LSAGSNPFEDSCYFNTEPAAVYLSKLSLNIAQLSQLLFISASCRSILPNRASCRSSQQAVAQYCNPTPMFSFSDYVFADFKI
jgi:hypothetical protein